MAPGDDVKTDEASGQKETRTTLPEGSFELIKSVDEDGQQIKRYVANTILSQEINTEVVEDLQRELHALAQRVRNDSDAEVADLVMTLWVEMLHMAQGNGQPNTQSAPAPGSEGDGQTKRSPVENTESFGSDTDHTETMFH